MKYESVFANEYLQFFWAGSVWGGEGWGLFHTCLIFQARSLWSSTIPLLQRDAATLTMLPCTVPTGVCFHALNPSLPLFRDFSYPTFLSSFFSLFLCLVAWKFSKRLAFPHLVICCTELWESEMGEGNVKKLKKKKKK